MPKLFVTGATGYIGGEGLYTIATTYPDLEITALVRNSNKGAKVAAAFPKTRLVYGDLGNTDLLKTEASKADIVLHCAHADHEGAAKALIAGLGQREKPGYLIHTSGTGLLAFHDFVEKTLGTLREKVYDDWDGLGEVTSLPDWAPHRNVEKAVLEGGAQYPGKVFTAIVSPPCIYGAGRGPDNRRSVQLPNLSEAVLRHKKGLQVGAGKNIWNEVHVQDLSNLFLRLVEEAIKGGGDATWNSEGYYFAENGGPTWGEVSKAVAKAAHDKKLIPTAEVDVVSPNAANNVLPSGAFLYGTNSRSSAIRARKLLGWKPVQKSMVDTAAESVEAEARALGLIKGHAAKAAGDA